MLDNGNVLIVGGADINDFDGLLATAEIYNPETMESRAVPSMGDARFKLPTPINLPGLHQILIVGGAEQGEVYRERSQQFTRVEGRLEGALSFPTATLLGDGTVLVTGGYDQEVRATDAVWIYGS
jgi:hypothetical protein